MGSAFYNIDRPLVLRLALGSDYPGEELLLVSSARRWGNFQIWDRRSRRSTSNSPDRLGPR